MSNKSQQFFLHSSSVVHSVLVLLINIKYWFLYLSRKSGLLSQSQWVLYFNEHTVDLRRLNTFSVNFWHFSIFVHKTSIFLWLTRNTITLLNLCAISSYVVLVWNSFLAILGTILKMLRAFIYIFIHQTGSKITNQTSTVILKKQTKLNYATT